MRIHFILQGKGGVGKSFIAWSLAQYKTRPDAAAPLCFDADPVNNSFSSFPGIGAEQITLIKGDTVDPRGWDLMTSRITESQADEVIIDVGATSFLPMNHYLISNDIPRFMEESGHEVFIHTIITGGAAMQDTLAGVTGLIHQYDLDGKPTAKIVVWLNPFFGTLDKDGLSLLSSDVFRKQVERKTHGLVHLPDISEYGDLFMEALSNLLKDKKTFLEAENDHSGLIMVRRRIGKIRALTFDALDIAQL